MVHPLAVALAILLPLQAGAPSSAEDRFQENLERERAAAEAALASGDRAKAAHHFRRRGMLFCERDWFGAAREDLRCAVREAVAANARTTELEARVYLGLAERWSCNPTQALEEERIVLSRIGPDDSPDLECCALHQAGDACFDLYRFGDALGYFQRMLEKAASASLESDVAVAWGKLGLVYMNLGEPSLAAECHEKALRAAEATGDPLTANRVRVFRAERFKMLGESEQAAKVLEEIFASEATPTLMIDALGGLAWELVSLGKFEEGRRRFEEAQALALEIGRDCYETRFLLSFGNLDADRGDLEQARRKFERALGLLDQPYQAAERGEVLLSLAGVLSLQGDPNAFEAYSQALATGRETCSRSLESRAAACIGDLYLSAGNVALARRHLQNARTAADSCDSVEPAAVATGMLAWLEETQGRHGEAAALAKESFDLYRLLGMDQQSLEVLDTLAAAALATRDETSLRKCVDLARGIFDSDFLRSSDLEECARLRAHLVYWAGHQQALASLELDRPGLEEPERTRILGEGFARAGEWKARALLGGLTQRRALPRTAERAAALAKHEEAERELLEIRLRIASAHGTGASPDVVHSLMATAEAVRLESDDLASRLRRDEAALGSAIAPSGRTPDEVRRAIPDDRTVLVEYVAGAGKLQAYVLTRSDLRLVDLGEGEPIERRVAEFQAGLGLKKPASTEAILAQARDLYRDLLAAPLRSLAADVDQLVVVPTPALASLPFEALIVPSAGKSEPAARFSDADFLVRRCAVTYAPSAAVFVELSAVAKRSGPSTILMVVDPAYPVASEEPVGGLHLMGRDLARLLFSRVEGCAVTRAFGGAADGEVSAFESGEIHSLSTERVLLLGGPESTPARFLAEAPKHAVIHVAAHGLADFEDPEQGALALSPHGSSDGLLTYRDVMRLPLQADLAVLSACDTGVGRPLAGEGILSLARAFMLAGSRSVLASLWPVDDRQTGETMGQFYRHYLAEGASVPRALRQAKLDAMAAPRAESGFPRGVTPGTRKSSAGRLTESADPWFWAPFVCVGPVR